MKRNRGWIACVLAGFLLIQSFCVVNAAEFAQLWDTVSGNSSVEAAVEEEEIRQEDDASVTVEQTAASLEDGEEDADKDAGMKETVSQNTVSENSVSENHMETAPETEGEPQNAPAEDEMQGSVSENTVQESVSENTTEESVSENTTEESVSENTTQESVSENTAEESVSENTVPESVSDNSVLGSSEMSDESNPLNNSREAVPPAAPVIKSITSKDTTAVIQFTYLLEETQAAQIQYEVVVKDEVKGVELPALSGKEAGVVTIGGYDGRAVNTFRIEGLTANKKYSAVLRAKYGEEGKPVSSVRKSFTTKKDMLATDGKMEVLYVSMSSLKSDKTAPMTKVASGIEMQKSEEYALFAQVSNLMRAVETDKLRWTVTAADGAPKNGIKVNASKSTYEAVLTAAERGSYQVTATNTLSKETVFAFQVTVK